MMANSRVPGTFGSYRAVLDSFYAAIGDEKSFYRPVVANADAHVYADAGGTKEACAAGDLVRAGTPVNVLQRSGAMSQVVLLDARWQWGTKNHCDAVVSGPVWIPSDAITSGPSGHSDEHIGPGRTPWSEGSQYLAWQ